MLEIYGSYGVFAGIAQTVYVVTAFLVGGHLLLRARESHDPHQRLLGLHLVLAMGLGFVLISTGLVLARYTKAPDPGLVALLIESGYAATILGLMATLLFNYRVFRRGSWSAAALALGVTGVMWVGWAGYGLTGGAATARYEGVWMVLQTGGILLANGWVALEPLLYHRKLARRRRLGLAEPLLVNRFWLWGCGSLTRTAMVLVGAIGSPYIEHVDTQAGVGLALGTLTLASFFGLFTSVSYWLTFRPPARYARWLERRHLGRAA